MKSGKMKRKEKQTETTSQKNQQNLGRLLELSPDAIVVINQDGTIAQMNAQAECLFGYGRNELQGKSMEVLIPERLRERYAEHRARYMAKPRAGPMGAHLELWGRRKDGSEFPVAIMLSPIETSRDNKVIVVMRHINDRKREVEEIRRLRQRASVLHEISSTVNSSLDLQTALEFLLEKLDSLLPYSVTTVRLLNGETGILEPTACKNIEEKEWKAIKWVPGRGLANLVLETKAPLAVTNAQTDPRTRHSAMLRKYRLVSYLGFPLIVKNEILGVLSFYTREEHRFSDEEIEFLSTLASHAAIAIYNSQLHEQAKEQTVALQKSSERTSALRDINLAINSSLDLETVLDFLLKKIDLLLPHCVATVRLLNKETEELEPVACRNIAEEDEKKWKALKWKGRPSLAAVVLETKQPLIVPNIQLDSRTNRTEILQKYGLVSYLGVPLMAEDETLGLIALYTKEEHHFTDEEIGFLSTLAGQAAVAIHNSQLYEKVKEQAIALERSHKRTAALHELNLTITSSLDLQMVLSLLLEKIDLLLPYSVATVRLLNRETGILEPTACRNLDERDWKARSGSGGAGLTQAVLETKAPVFIADARLDPRTKNPERIVHYGLRSYLGFPLIVKDEPLGVISFYTKEKHFFSTEEIEFFSTLAGQAAIAIHNSQLYEQAKRQTVALQKFNEDLTTRTRQQQIVAHLGQLALAGTDIPLLIDEAAALVAQTLRVEYCGILEMLPESETLVLRAATGWQDGYRGNATVSVSPNSYTGYVLLSGEPIVIEDLGTERRFTASSLLSSLGLISGLCVAIRDRNQPLGVLEAFTAEKRVFKREDTHFLQAVANVLAEAMAQKQAQEALQKSEERFRIVARATNDVVWDWDLLTNGVWVNEGVRTLFGYSAEEIHDVTWWYENIHPDDRERVIGGIHALIGSSEQLWSDEYRFRCADGSFACIFDRGYVIRNSEEKPVRMIGAMMDITERKRAEEKSAASETRLRTIIASEPECVKILDRNGTVLEMNPAGLAMIEAESATEILGKSVYPLVTEKHRQAFRELHENVFQGRSGILEFEMVGLKGTHRWLETHAVPVHNETGKIVDFLSITRDISERKRLEKEILEISEREQQRIGQDLHDGLGQHLAGLAYLMKGLEQKLAAQSSPQGADAALITELVNQAIAQTRSLARGLYPVQLEANGLMWALEELASNAARIFNIPCLFQCSEPVLIHDNSAATHLYRIAQQAVDNAIQHGRAKQVWVKLSAVNGKIVLSISDDGVGLPETSSVKKGMGFHIMRYRAEMIGAFLDIQRREEGGTTVTCSL